jgi:hypothetical protein
MAAALNVLAIGYSTEMEFFSNKSFNYGTITIDPKLSPPRVQLDIRDEAGAVLYKTEIAPV